jgi:hypothetical protein
MANKENKRTARGIVIFSQFIKSWEYNNTEYHTFMLKFDNGDSGEVNVRDKNDPYFEMGKEVEYVAYEQVRKDGTTRDKRIGKPDTYPRGGNSYIDSAKNAKYQAVISAMDYASNAMFVMEGVGAKDIPAYFKAFLNPMLLEIDIIDGK